MKLNSRILLVMVSFGAILFYAFKPNSTADFSFDKEGIAIYLDQKADSLVVWAAHDLAADIELLTGKVIPVHSSSSYKNNGGIYIGEINSSLMKSLSSETFDKLKGIWEGFYIKKHNGNLIIAGSDVRGTVYGIFEVAERLGISPWKWWADVRIIPVEQLSFSLSDSGIFESPSVKYRGIFLNDEDWGLQPWAAKTFEPETGNIGPKTYEKIFQLLLRLKANTIWPAMHPCTKGFYQMAGNNAMAKKYHMVVGTSHCEPMLRNNVDEWNHEKDGDFNFFTNDTGVCNYWQSRMDEVVDAENIITMGMRGVHDGHMEGGENIEDKVKMLEHIFQVQRDMLVKTKNKPVDSIAQTLVLYKEVLDLYNEGLQVPDDISLMWCDDNYGYIRQLSNDEEQKRSGGSGVYYHLSYWGRPHDYLWLSTTQPGLIWFEMQKAYANGAQNSWIANVGDIKPAEYNMELFLAMAWDISLVKNTTIEEHAINWAAREFGHKPAKDIAAVMNEYYRLAFIRKPEFMGWSGVEPRTDITRTSFNNKEQIQRVQLYKALLNKVDSIVQYVPLERKDAYFQLVEYPVKGAALMNFKFLYAQLASESTDTLSRARYAQQSTQAFEQIAALTSYYNEQMSGGKWKHIMSMKPRNLPVYGSANAIFENKNIEQKTVKENESNSTFFIQANEYLKLKNANEYHWEVVKGLGYSANAITLMPLIAKQFSTNEQPWLQYEFNAERNGKFELQVKCLPTHCNNLNQQIAIQIDNEEIIPFALNTKGRSKAWKENVLQNSVVAKVNSEIARVGKHSIRIYVNQTGIVIDQLTIDFNVNSKYHEENL